MDVRFSHAHHRPGAEGQVKTSRFRISRFSWEPRVLGLGTTESITLTVVVDSDPANLQVVLTTRGCAPPTVGLDLIPLLPVAPKTYQATLTADQLLHNYQDGDAHAIVGCPELAAGEQKLNLLINVKTPAMPDVPGRRGQAVIQRSRL